MKMVISITLLFLTIDKAGGQNVNGIYFVNDFIVWFYYVLCP